MVAYFNFDAVYFGLATPCSIVMSEKSRATSTLPVRANLELGGTLQLIGETEILALEKMLHMSLEFPSSAC